jgi:hypothetical protein
MYDDFIVLLGLTLVCLPPYPSGSVRWDSGLANDTTGKLGEAYKNSEEMGADSGVPVFPFPYRVP